MKRLLSGNEAIARGAYEAGVVFATGYPGTPSSEILANLIQYNSAQVEWAQLILLADLDNLDCFKREFPEAVSKTTMLGFFLSRPSAVIEDPYNLNSDDARVATQKILAAVEGLVAWLREHLDR